MSDNRICKLPCSQYKPDGPTDLGVGGWCKEYHEAVLLIDDCQKKNIIEAVLAGELSKADIDAIGYSLEHPNDRLISLEKEWRVIWDGRTYSIEQDNLCPTCGGSKEEPVGCYEPMMSGEPIWNACDDDFHKPCPDCRGDHFIPGKGKGL